MTQTAPVQAPSPADLESLESIWDGSLRPAFEQHLEAASRLEPGWRVPVALAAALVETGLDLQDLGRDVPDPGRLLLADLCLARASRLLSDTGDQELQVGFARAVEDAAAAAAAGRASAGAAATLRALIEARA